MFIFGVLTSSRGVAIALSGFVTEALMNEGSDNTSGYGMVTKLGALIIYTGVTTMVASLGAVAKFVPHRLKVGKEIEIWKNLDRL